MLRADYGGVYYLAHEEHLCFVLLSMMPLLPVTYATCVLTNET